ncbi:MAG: Na(+)/H(+) antiporter subunit B [Alphaproteobacteria bacterium]|nr:Na(+)/H(+) antiporter subunit B [Alphaproteobacteria bacterium]
MKEIAVLRVVTKLVIPFIALFGFYIQLHGEISPGGGFQSGVVIAASIIIYGLVFGITAAQKAYPRGLAIRLSALGLLIYTGMAAYTVYAGGEMLNYSVIAHDAIHGQHNGIFIIELGVCITVTNVMVLIYYMFGSHQLTLSSRKDK